MKLLIQKNRLIQLIDQAYMLGMNNTSTRELNEWREKILKKLKDPDRGRSDHRNKYGHRCKMRSKIKGACTRHNE